MDVEFGMVQWFRYFQDVPAFPQMAVEGGDLDEMVEFVNGGLGVVGTPDQAVERIAAYRAAGADGVNIALRLPVDGDALEAYLTEVVPTARAELA